MIWLDMVCATNQCHICRLFHDEIGFTSNFVTPDLTLQVITALSCCRNKPVVTAQSSQCASEIQFEVKFHSIFPNSIRSCTIVFPLGRNFQFRLYFRMGFNTTVVNMVNDTIVVRML